MPSFISKDGVWEPAKEKAAIVNAKGEPEIYSGPDRAAVEYMKEQGATTLGTHFTKDPEVIMRARQMNMTVEEFCNTKYYTDEMRAKDYAAASKEVVTHVNPTPKPATKFASGGRNTAGAGHYDGGFGDKSEAISKVK